MTGSARGRRATPARRGLVVGLVLVAAGGIGACGDDDAEGSSDTEPTTTTVDAEAEVIAAYEASNTAFGAAADPPDPQYPDLLATHTGDALEKAQNTLSQWAAEGAVIQGEATTDVQDVTVNGEEAAVSDCFVDNSTLVNATSGATIQAGDGSRQRAASTMVLEDGTWKLSRFVLEGEPCE